MINKNSTVLNRIPALKILQGRPKSLRRSDYFPATGQDSYLLSLSVALKHKGTEGRLSLLLSLTPVSPLHHKAHEPAVLLMSSKLGDIPELKLIARKKETKNGSDRTGARTDFAVLLTQASNLLVPSLCTSPDIKLFSKPTSDFLHTSSNNVIMSL